jgi:prepilin-type N-terminal cleavage/methylation domain
MPNHKDGFTLLETVISLTIICILTTISIYNLKDYQAKMEERQSLEWFKNSFKNAFNKAFLTKSGIEVIVEKQNEVIFDITNNGKGSDIHISRRFPKTIKIFESSNNSYMIYGSGQAKAVTFTFVSSLTNRKYKYVVQLGWGEIIETKT